MDVRSLCSTQQHRLLLLGAGGKENAPLQITAGGAGVDAAAGSLKQRVTRFVCSNPLPAQLIRRYVSYARAHCHPVLCTEAKQRLKDFYLELRKLAALSPSLPITVRLPKLERHPAPKAGTPSRLKLEHHPAWRSEVQAWLPHRRRGRFVAWIDADAEFAGTAA